jgi:uncharacterized protein (DUF488 family)
VQLSFGLDPVLYIAGYQGRELDAFVRLMTRHEITQVIDVRERPSSRRPGFAKSPLAAALESAGIRYVHVREAGNPFRHEGLESKAILAKYARHIDAHPEIVNQVATLARERPSALLCFEHDPSECHRSVLADRVARVFPCRVVSL